MGTTWERIRKISQKATRDHRKHFLKLFDSLAVTVTVLSQSQSQCHSSPRVVVSRTMPRAPLTHGRVRLPHRDADCISGKSLSYASRYGVPHPVEFSKAVAQQIQHFAWGSKVLRAYSSTFFSFFQKKSSDCIPIHLFHPTFPNSLLSRSQVVPKSVPKSFPSRGGVSFSGQMSYYVQ